MSSIKARISGPARLMAKLSEIQNVIFPVVAAEIENAAMAVHRSAVISIRAHESQGKTYRRGTVEHTASAPGNPPNSDMGTLANSIKFEIDKNALQAVVGTNLKYGKFLEIGTVHIKERPWLFPAFEMHKEENKANIMDALKVAVRMAALKSGGSAI